MMTAFELIEVNGLTLHGDIEHFAELVRADSRNATLDEIADKIGKMPFGDTAASFAVWIREQKTCT